MFAPNAGAQMEPEAVLPTDPIQAETCFNTFTPFFTTPDADASTSGAWRAFVHPDASPNFEVGATKEIGFTISASHMLSWPNSFLQFGMKLDMDKTDATWIGRMRAMGVKFMPDLKMIFDKIDLLINESPFQVITEFPRVNFIRSNILGGSKEWIKIVQGGTYIASPELKTNSLEMGGGTISQKVISSCTAANNYKAGDRFVQSGIAGTLPTNSDNAVALTIREDGPAYAANTAFHNIYQNPTDGFGQPCVNVSSLSEATEDDYTEAAARSTRNERINSAGMIFAPSEDMDMLDVLERGHEVLIQIPFRDLFSSLSSVQWMPGPLFRRIGMRFHIRSDPSTYLLGYMMSSIASNGAVGSAAAIVPDDANAKMSFNGYTFHVTTPARPQVENIQFKFSNARCVLFGQAFSPNLIAEFKSYMDSKSDLQAVWYQAYMYYRVIRIMNHTGNVMDQNFTTISPGSAWLLSDPWYEESTAYKQKQRIMIPTVVNAKSQALCYVDKTVGAGQNLAVIGTSIGKIADTYRTISSFIPISPIANKLISRSYIAINGCEFPPTYENQHWNMLSQCSTVHSTLGTSLHEAVQARGKYPVSAEAQYTPHFLLGSTLGKCSSVAVAMGDVYYPPYFEKCGWVPYDALTLVSNSPGHKLPIAIAASFTHKDFYDVSTADSPVGGNYKSGENACSRLCIGHDFYHTNNTGLLPIKQTRLEENYLRYMMTTGFHIDPFQNQSTLIGYEQWNTLWPIIAFPIGTQDSATGAPMYEATAMTGRLHLEKEAEGTGVALPYYLIIQEAYLTAICADGSLVTMIGTA